MQLSWSALCEWEPSEPWRPDFLSCLTTCVYRNMSANDTSAARVPTTSTWPVSGVAVGPQQSNATTSPLTFESMFPWNHTNANSVAKLSNVLKILRNMSKLMLMIRSSYARLSLGSRVQVATCTCRTRKVWYITSRLHAWNKLQGNALVVLGHASFLLCLPLRELKHVFVGNCIRVNKCWPVLPRSIHIL